ncbi:unnamed protein product, partial [Ectocarpus sp. 12 AP-2014]
HSNTKFAKRHKRVWERHEKTADNNLGRVYEVVSTAAVEFTRRVTAMPTGRQCADGLPLHEVHNPHQAQPCEQEAIVPTPLWCMRSTRRPTAPTGSNRADGC